MSYYFIYEFEIINRIAGILVILCKRMLIL